MKDGLVSPVVASDFSLPDSYVGGRRRGRGEVGCHAAAEQVQQDLRSALVGDVHDVDARALC